MKAVLRLGLPFLLLGCSEGRRVHSSQDAERLCSRREILLTKSVHAPGCATPDGLAELYSGYVSLPNGVQFELKRLWDGSLPKVAKVEYRHFPKSTMLGEMRPLTCEGIEDTAEKRRFECRLAEGDRLTWGKYVLGAITLANEHCGASASYESQYLVESCRWLNEGWAMEQLSTYLGEQTFLDIPQGN